MQQRNPVEASFNMAGVLFPLRQIVTMDSQYRSNSPFIMFLTGIWTTQPKHQMKTGYSKRKKLMKLRNSNNFQSQTQPMRPEHLLRLNQKNQENSITHLVMSKNRLCKRSNHSNEFRLQTRTCIYPLETSQTRWLKHDEYRTTWRISQFPTPFFFFF